MIESERIQRPKLVLVVDDQEINRDVLEMILEDDYEIIFATNGQEAMEQIEFHLKDLSIILLDLVMPVMDGFEVLERVRNDDQMSRIPIIVLTAERDAELKALQMGAADFIVKPFDMHEVILARVERIIELSEGRQLISAAEHDRLSGLYTRNFFFEYVNRLYTFHPELPMDAVVVNIEQFHNVNALNGREFGDEILRCIGGAIRAYLSTADGMASRFEADQFGIFCSHQDDYGVMRDALQESVNLVSPNVNIHLRMGVSLWQEGVEPVVMFDRARAACSMARGDYLHPLKVYNEDMLRSEMLNQQLLNDLRRAVEERQFKVFYQPKYDVQSNPPRLNSAEALIRWQHPEFGLISPAVFIPLFEGNGLIGVVDEFVWNEAARQVAYWRDEYGFTLPVSVNISRSDIFDTTLVDRLQALVSDNDLVQANLKLEITESAYTDNAKELISVIDSLRDLGFEIEMDDFGSGYSSLNMLSEMPFDVLKMDMKFIRNIETNEMDRRLVNLIMDIARNFEVLVVAEGVETQGQLEILQGVGCDIVQGYYFSRPLPPEEFEELIIKEQAIERNYDHDTQGTV